MRRILFRALTGLGVLWGAATLAFLTVQLTPGDPAYAIVGGPEAAPSREVVERVREQYGFDQPVLLQYLAYLGRLLTGDLGDSYQLKEPVTRVIGDQVGGTIQLALAAAVLALLIAFVVALLTAKRRPAVRSTASGLELLFASTPSFWLGLLLLSVFSYGLHWVPAIGNHGFVSLILPAVTLALPIGAVLSQVLRSSLEETLEQPFIVTARARGLGEAGVRIGHALRHSVIPVITMAGFIVGGLLGGAVIVESLFSRQGLGRVLLTAVNAKDMPVVLGIVLLSAAVYVVVNFLVDLLYPLVDPRMRRAA